MKVANYVSVYSFVSRLTFGVLVRTSKYKPANHDFGLVGYSKHVITLTNRAVGGSRTSSTLMGDTRYNLVRSSRALHSKTVATFR